MLVVLLLEVHGILRHPVFHFEKENSHVSTLHVIHHGCMPFSVWMNEICSSTFFALLNTFVHIVMYFYYMIAAMGPKYQNPVLDDAPNGLKKSSSNGTLNNTYIKSEYSDSYEAYYSNGSTKGFVAQTITKQPNNKKIE
nr:unnamed protein product [Callosobruchus analis]